MRWHLLALLFPAMVLLAPRVSQAVTRTWTGLGTTNNWSEAANWSALPGSGDVATFNSTSVKACTINVDPNVAGILIASGYSGTITQAAGVPVTIGASGFVFSATTTTATFVGGNAAMNISGPFTLSATLGSFTATSGTTTVTGAFTHTTAATFTANGGTVAFTGGATTTVSVSGHTFNNVTINKNPSFGLTVTNSQTITVAGTLTLTDGFVNQTTIPAVPNGTITAQGDITHGAGFDGGTGLICITGAATRTINLTGGGNMPGVYLNAANVTLNGPASLTTVFAGTTNSFNLQAGTVTGGAGAMTFNLIYTQSGGSFTGGAGTVTATGAFTLSAGTFTSGTTTTLSSTLALSGTGIFNGGSGSTSIAGATTASAGTLNGGSGSLTFAAATFSGAAVDGQTAAWNFNGLYTLSAGTFTATSGTTTFAGGFTHTLATGTFTHNSGTAVFSGLAATVNVNSTENFYNLTVNKNDAVLLTVSAGDTLAVAGTLRLTNGKIATGTVNAQGDVIHESGFDGGTGLISITGAATRTINLTGGGNMPGVSLNAANVTMNGPASGTTAFEGTTTSFALVAGTVTGGAGAMTFNLNYSQSGGSFSGGAGAVTFTGTYTLTNGTFTASSGNTTFALGFTHSTAGTFSHNNGTVTFSGLAASIDVIATETFYNFTINKNPGVALTVTASDNLIVAGTLTLTDGLLNQGTIPVTGTINAQAGITHGAGFDGGTGTIFITGAATRTINLTGGGNMPGVNLNAANVTLNGPTSVATTTAFAGTVTSFKLQAGTVTGGAGDMTFNLKYDQTGGSFDGGGFGSGTVTVTGAFTQSAGNFTGASSTNFGNTFGLSGTGTFNVGTNCFPIFGGAVTASGGTFNGGGGSGILYFAAAATFSGATVNGGTQTWAFNSTFTLSAGSFTASSGNTDFANTFTHTVGGTFDPNNGTAVFNGAAATVSVNVSETFYNLTVLKDTGTALIVANSDTLIVTGTLTLTDGVVNQTTIPAVSAGGTIAARGPITQATTFDGGTGLLVINGAGDQTFTGESPNVGTLPNVTVNKASGILTLASIVRTTKAFDVSVGTVYTGTSTLAGTLGTFTLSSGATLGIGSADGITSSGATGNIQVTGTRSFDPAANYIYNGTAIQVTGNGLPATVNNLTINNSTSVTLSGNVTVSGLLSVSAGTFDQGASFNVIANGNPTAISIIFGATYKNVGTGDLTLGGSVSNAGTVQMDSGTSACGEADSILIRSSASPTQRSWSGAGTFDIQDVNVMDQAGTASIIAYSSTDSGGNGGNWSIRPHCKLDHFAVTTPGTQTVGTPFPITTITAQDANNNTVTNYTGTVDLTETGDGTGGTVTPSQSSAFTAGVLSGQIVTLSKAGLAVTITVTDHGGTKTGVSGTFRVNAGATKLGFGTQPSNTQGGSSITPAVTVRILDAGDNLVSDSTASVTVAIGTNPGGGTFSGTLMLPAVAGVATFNDLSIDKAATGYTLTAASTGLTGATSGTFDIVGTARWVDNATGSDANPGTQAAPLATIGQAVNVAGTSGTVYVHVGNSQSVSPYAANNIVTVAGTGAYPVRILGVANGSTLPLVVGTNPAADAGFDVQASYVTVSGFQIQNTQVGLYSEPSKIGTRFTNNYVLASYLGYGIILDTTSSATASGNRIAPGSGGSSFFGIWDYTGNGNTIDGNTVTGQGADGIASHYSTGLTIQRNIVAGNPNGIHVSHASGAVHLYNNTVDGSAWLGIYVEQSPTATVTSRNNIVVNGGYGWAWDGTGTAIDSDYDDVFGNTHDYDYTVVVTHGSHMWPGADPNFVQTTDPTSASYYQLNLGSPCINTGVNVGLPKIGSGWDIGAVESN